MSRSRVRVHEARRPSGAPEFCTTAQKVIHANKTAARKKIRWQRSQPDCVDGDYLQPYRCGDHWHIGHGWNKP